MQMAIDPSLLAKHLRHPIDLWLAALTAMNALTQSGIFITYSMALSDHRHQAIISP